MSTLLTAPIGIEISHAEQRQKEIPLLTAPIGIEIRQPGTDALNFIGLLTAPIGIEIELRFKRYGVPFCF